jgi:hypothetical protein
MIQLFTDCLKSQNEIHRPPRRNAQPDPLEIWVAVMTNNKSAKPHRFLMRASSSSLTLEPRGSSGQFMWRRPTCRCLSLSQIQSASHTVYDEPAPSLPALLGPSASSFGRIGRSRARIRSVEPAHERYTSSSGVSSRAITPLSERVITRRVWSIISCRWNSIELFAATASEREIAA